MIRTRMAPSPTGFLHVGNLRTTLYSYLFARQHKGQFILRIEDTDQARFVEGAVESLLRTLDIVGVHPDEGPYLASKSPESTDSSISANNKIEQKGDFGPYIQSERFDVYKKYAQELLERKAAYLCFCTSQRLEQMREEQTKNKQAPMYDRRCLQLTPEEIEKNLQESLPHVIRQNIPRNENLEFTDLIRGLITFKSNNIDDQVLVKSDGFPTYHLANVVDDHLMKITHVIRGEEWLPSTPKHVLLYRAFQWDPPHFAHLPLLLNKDKTKLSKRQGDVSVESYLEKGYSVEALINFVAMLGWHPGSGEEQEIFSIDELMERFSLEKVHKAGAIFDLEKLDWFNFQWQKRIHHEQLERIAKGIDPHVTITADKNSNPIFEFTDDAAKAHTKAARFTQMRGGLLAETCKKYIPLEWLKDEDLLAKALITVEEKIFRNPSQIEANIAFYFDGYKPPHVDVICNQKMKVNEQIARDALSAAAESLETFEHFDRQEKLQQHLLGLVEKLELKNGQVFWPLRAALSGEQFSPGVFELLWALGKTESLRRIRKTLESSLA